MHWEGDILDFREMAAQTQPKSSQHRNRNFWIDFLFVFVFDTVTNIVDLRSSVKTLKYNVSNYCIKLYALFYELIVYHTPRVNQIQHIEEYWSCCFRFPDGSQCLASKKMTIFILRAFKSKSDQVLKILTSGHILDLKKIIKDESSTVGNLLIMFWSNTLEQYNTQ